MDSWDFGSTIGDLTTSAVPLATSAATGTIIAGLVRDVAVTRLEIYDGAADSVGEAELPVRVATGGTCQTATCSSIASQSSYVSSLRPHFQTCSPRLQSSNGVVAGDHPPLAAPAADCLVETPSFGMREGGRFSSGSSCCAASGPSVAKSSTRGDIASMNPSSSSSIVPLVVAPVLARMLGVHQDKQVSISLFKFTLLVGPTGWVLKLRHLWLFCLRVSFRHRCKRQLLS